MVQLSQKPTTSETHFGFGQCCYTKWARWWRWGTKGWMWSHTVHVSNGSSLPHQPWWQKTKQAPEIFNSDPTTKWLTAHKQFIQSMPHESSGYCANSLLKPYPRQAWSISVTTRITNLKSQHTWGSPPLLIQDALVRLAIPLQRPSNEHAPEPAIFLHQNDGQMDPSWHATFLRRGLDLEE